ncbi:Butyrophilin subfamily 3 member A2 [Nibea albiflora]|uniref:Butyrophilin subfamily 3 member A2 n=1 Tax=Nibea albiflora TaxID=240163 RepID=A0ACB7EYQ9_NIBAL|nr:Butyrophilin subfamily 3 member A2 [Nibea albiflora]
MVSSGLTPVAAKLSITPNRAQFFQYDFFIMKCEVGEVRRNTSSASSEPCLPGWGSKSNSTCKVDDAFKSDTGEYWCESLQGERSNSINITVTEDAVILVSPAHPVTDEDEVTLLCSCKAGDNITSDFSAKFFKNGVFIGTEPAGKKTLEKVSRSDEGYYECEHTTKGRSLKSWLAVRARTPSNSTSIPITPPPPTPPLIPVPKLVCSILLFILYTAIFIGCIYMYRKWAQVRGLNEQRKQSWSPVSSCPNTHPLHYVISKECPRPYVRHDAIKVSQYRVVCSSQPIVVALGDDVILPCHVKPEVNVVGRMVIWWTADIPPDPEDPQSEYRFVHKYDDYHDIEDMKMESYAGRTTLDKNGLKHGNVSLKITNTRLSDQARYRCEIPELMSSSTIKLVVGQPQVIGSLTPIVAAPGDDVILPCHLEPSTNVEALTVEWSKPDLKPDPSDRLSRVEYVHLYRDRREVPDMKIQSYVERTALFPDRLKHGNISLKILNVTLEDEGRYKCFIPRLNSPFKDSIVQLVVGALLEGTLRVDVNGDESVDLPHLFGNSNQQHIQ